LQRVDRITLIIKPKPSEFQKIVADAAIDAGREMQFLKTLEQAEDHPVAGPYPEGHYLKGFLCRVK
jgi:23S rRNA (cytosine1962-C5)-methyltransferase